MQEFKKKCGAVDTSRLPGPALGLAGLIAFLLLCDVGWSLNERAVPDLFKFQLRRFSEDTVLLSVMLGALPSMVALLACPLVGAWSDRHRSPLGRRIPFLLVCAPMVSVCLVGLAYSDAVGVALWRWQGASQGLRERYIVVSMCVWWTLFELFAILASAMFLALINDTVPHRMIGRFFGVFRMISLGTGAIFFGFVFSNELPAVLRSVMVAVAALYLAGFGVLCYRVREQPFPPEAPRRRFRLSDWRGETGTRRWFYVLLFVTLAIASACLLPVNVNSYNAIDQFGVDRSDYGRAVAISYVISIGLALPLGCVADRYHPLRVGFVVLGLYALCMLGAGVLVTERVSFLAWFMVHSVLAGTFLTGTSSLLPLLLPRARFSSLAALSGAMTAVLAVVVTIGTGRLLALNGHNFRTAFLASGVLAAVASAGWLCLLILHRRAGDAPRPAPAPGLHGDGG